MQVFQSLRIETKPFGIDVIVVEPGGIKTELGDISADHLEEYSFGGAYAASAKGYAAMLRKQYAGNNVELSAESEGCELPEIVLGVELVLLVNLIRKATKKNIVPHKVMVKRPFENSCYEKFLGVEAETGEKNALIFTEQDAHVPFVTHNESMWSFF